jgi:hypothetical protein
MAAVPASCWNIIDSTKDWNALLRTLIEYCPTALITPASFASTLERYFIGSLLTDLLSLGEILTINDHYYQYTQLNRKRVVCSIIVEIIQVPI